MAILQKENCGCQTPVFLSHTIRENDSQTVLQLGVSSTVATIALLCSLEPWKGRKVMVHWEVK